MRVMVVWCPDWSVVAALEEAERSPRSPAAVLLGQRRRGVQRSRPGRGRTTRAAPPRRPGQVPRAGAAARQPRPRRPGLRARAGRGRGAASRGGRAAPGTARRPGARQLVRHRDRRRRDRLPGAGRDRRLGRADRHRRRPLHRRAGGPHRRRAVVDGRARGRLRAVPARAARRTCCRTTVPRGRELVGLLQRLGLRTLGDLADLPGDAVEHRLGRLRRRRAATRPGRGPHAVRGPHPAARARRAGGLRAAAGLRRGDHLQRAHDRRAVRRPAGPPPARRHRGAGRGRVRRRRLLVARLAAPAPLQRPRPRRPGPLAAAVGRRRRLAARPQGVRAWCARRSSGSGSCPRWSSRPPPTARRCGAARPTTWSSAGVARVQGMVGFDAVRRPVLQGGRSPVGPAGAGAVGRARGRPAPARPAVAGPGARAGAGPGVRRSPGRRGRRRRRPGGVRHRPRRGDRRAAALPGPAGTARSRRRAASPGSR